MSEHLFELFDEYAAAYARGERPSAEEFLDRAGAGRDELARMLEEFLQRTPVQPPSDDEARRLELLLSGEPPLLVLRRERKLRREHVVEALRERLGLAPELREKLALRYHELETGQLEPARVDRRVWEALAEALQAGVAELAARARPLPAREAPVMFRATATRSAAAAMREKREEPDEVDRLFGLS